MEPENISSEIPKTSFCNKVTPLSKYLAMVLFIVLPFIGGYLGYQYGYSDSQSSIKEAGTEKILTNNQRNFNGLDDNPRNIGGNFFISNKEAVYVSTPKLGLVEIEGINPHFAKVIKDNYVIKDDTAVYTDCSGKFEPLVKGDISPHAPSFDIVEWPYFKDAYHVYYFNTHLSDENPYWCDVTILEGADSQTFEVFDGQINKACDYFIAGDLDPYRPIFYVKDENHVYCKNEVVENAVPEKCTNEETSGCEYQPLPN